MHFFFIYIDTSRSLNYSTPHVMTFMSTIRHTRRTVRLPAYTRCSTLLPSPPMLHHPTPPPPPPPRRRRRLYRLFYFILFYFLCCVIWLGDEPKSKKKMVSGQPWNLKPRRGATAMAVPSACPFRGGAGNNISPAVLIYTHTCMCIQTLRRRKKQPTMERFGTTTINSGRRVGIWMSNLLVFSILFELYVCHQRVV